jgi:hypothetical protein
MEGLEMIREKMEEKVVMMADLRDISGSSNRYTHCSIIIFRES